ncbi:Chromosome partition protein smc, partial [hydrothermal vent metagenome]
QNRRRVLEEAAGISGLHTRRHEAELRLRAAETNLARLDDIGEEIEAQHQQLKRQVRVASRYRNLAGEIRALESFAALLRWTEAKTNLQTTRIELQELEQKSGELAGIAARALAAAEAANDGIEGLREEQAIANAVVARLAGARESVERDERDAKARQSALEIRLQELARDLAHEAELRLDATGSIARLQDEQNQLQRTEDNQDQAQAIALQETAQQAALLRDATEAKFEQLTQQQAERNALIANAANILATAHARASRLQQELDQCQAQRDGLTPDLETLAALKTAETEQQTTASTVEQFRQNLQTQEQKLAETDETVQQLRRAFDDSRRQRDELAAEQAGLIKAMATLDDDSWVPVSENLEVSPGFERALAVALGDDLQASTQSDAPAHWDAGETPKQSLPGNVQVLAELVSAPDALSARLSQIGVVDFATGEKLAASLLPGQRLVTREGHLWRWDGLRLNADVPSAAAHRLEQKNRLTALEPLGENCQKQTMAHRESWLAAKETRTELQQVLKT